MRCCQKQFCWTQHVLLRPSGHNICPWMTSSCCCTQRAATTIVFIFACWIANGTTDVNIIIHFQQEMNLQYPHTTLQLLLEVYFPFGPNSFVTCNELKIVMTTTVMTITYGVLKHNRTSFLPVWTLFPPSLFS